LFVQTDVSAALSVRAGKFKGSGSDILVQPIRFDSRLVPRLDQGLRFANGCPFAGFSNADMPK
jgi:hypothetical protein